MTTNIIFFDLDGTLRQTKSGKTFIDQPEDQKPIEGTQKALAYYQGKGFVLIGISNQGGVAAGYKSLQSAIEEQRITLELFPELSEIFFCPNYDGESCYQVSRDNEPLLMKTLDLMNSCRKPGAGMIELAMRGFSDLDIAQSWMIGDRPEDQQCAEAAGIKFVWASVMHSKFASPGMREIECQHIAPDILMEFLAL
jgi:D-glycero-D-manno-heptose 1,7-bisphosphate phosphatase